MKDKNGKTIAPGARVVVIKYGDMRVGTVTKTKVVEENQEGQNGYRRTWKSELVTVALDPTGPAPEMGAGRYAFRAYERRNRWVGQSTQNILVLQEAT